LWLGWIMWIPFLVPNTIDLFKAAPPPLVLWLTLAAEVVFAGVYARAARINARDLSRMPVEEYQEQARRQGPTIVLLAVLAVINTYLGSLSKIEMMSCFIFTSAYVAGVLRPKGIIATNGVILLIGFAVDGVFNQAWFFWGLFLFVVVSFTTASWVGSILLTRELAGAQAEIAAMAVGAERLRIARDLHDLLGQKLSAVVLKSQLGRKLLRHDPDRAEAEIAGVEDMGRSMLQDVRDAVGRYRRPTLDDEIRAARELLSAAEIRFVWTDGRSGSTGDWPEPYDEVLAWAIREGVTNIVRHSRAAECQIRLSHETGWRLSIQDDGSGTTASAGHGHGLTGLTDRVNAVGGRVEAGPRAQSGFTLTVQLPASGNV
jgi:two-component system sensor histidine kinase DesK